LLLIACNGRFNFFAVRQAFILPLTVSKSLPPTDINYRLFFTIFAERQLLKGIFRLCGVGIKAL
jgi:hypothetical protein